MNENVIKEAQTLRTKFVWLAEAKEDSVKTKIQSWKSAKIAQRRDYTTVSITSITTQIEGRWSVFSSSNLSIVEELNKVMSQNFNLKDKYLYVTVTTSRANSSFLLSPDSVAFLARQSFGISFESYLL